MERERERERERVGRTLRVNTNGVCPRKLVESV